MDSDTASEYLPTDKIRYALNCITSSTSEGQQGVITNPKGNTMISVDLPEGENKTIGAVADEENNRFLYAVWNELGFHTWFQYDSTSNTITRIIQSRTDSKDEDIFRWLKTDLILGLNIVDGNKLYWTVYGSDHPARKINIEKMISRQDPGYDDIIQSAYTLAYKEAPVYPPTAEYFTNTDLKSNNVYGKLFKFAIRYIYDDYEFSTFSDFSTVAIPGEEDVTGTKGVPLINNGIRVSFLTGNPLVRKIELIMKRTNPEIKAPNSEMDWVSLVVLDKDVLDIPDNTQYEYEFYNDHSYLSINQEEVIMPYSDLPDYPKAQDYSGNVIFYGNFKSGFPTVKVDMDIEVQYEELFVPDSTENVLNNPELTFFRIDEFYESIPITSGGGGRRHTKGRITVGPDVKSGNIFKATFTNDNFSVSVKATLNDTSSTIAAKIRSVFLTHDRMVSVSDIKNEGAGYYSFEFHVYNAVNKPYIGVTTAVTPVNYAKLKDTGNSVKNEKLGSTFRYGLVYESRDTSKTSLVYVDVDNLVAIKNMSELGDIKKVSTILNINHKAPSWASRYQVVRTKNLTKSDYIQVLVQGKATVKDADSNDLYQDLVIGSLFTYQQIHADTALRYEFKKGDRVRLLKTYDDSSDTWSVSTNVIDYEVINYFPEVVNEIDADAKVDGTNIVVVGDAPDQNNIGSYIRINNSERLIVGVSGGGYEVEYPFTEETSSTTKVRTYPSYTIINRRGVIRIKENPSFPIPVVTGSVYGLIEVYNPAQSFENAENENYYAIGYKFDIVEQDGKFYHRGNVQDQTDTLPAIVKVEGFDNYVRNRQLPTNNAIKNTQLIFTSIEDKSFSDFYVSNLTSYGRVNRLDDARGVTNFNESIIHSQNRIEGTKVNGLSMFRTLNRRDYNDKYGSIERIMFHDSILYVLKNLKTAWLPVNANIISDTSGMSRILTASDDVIPKRLEYITWEDGVGKNPESAFRTGNDIWLICPNSGVVLRIQGGGSEVVSTPLKFDKEIRDKVTAASISGAKILGGHDPYLKMNIWNIEGYEVVVFNNGWFSNNSEIVPVDIVGEWQVLSNPANGSLSMGAGVMVYSPNQNFSGMDYFSYKSSGGITRNIAVNVLSADTVLSWVPSGQYCLENSGTRTGEVGYSILLQYDNVNQQYTGVSKANSVGDPDYVAPVMNTDICPIGLEFTRFAVLSADKASQQIEITITTAEDVNIQARAGQSYTGTLIAETGLVPSGTYTINLPVGSGEYSLFLLSPTLNYNGVTRLIMKKAYIKTAKFNDLKELTELVLDQSAIPGAHNLVFNTLDVSQNTKLEKLHVIHHRIPSISLTPNTLIEDLNVSLGINLTALGIGSWNVLKELRIHDSAFTAANYTTSLIDSIITSFNANTPPAANGWVLQYGYSNSTGIRPSGSVISAYNSLVSKGVSVIGVPPVTSTMTIDLFSEGVPGSPNNFRVRAVMAGFLSVNVVIPVTVIYSEGGIDVGTGNTTINIPAGTSTAFGVTDFVASPEMVGVVGDISYATVNPNPAGGVNLNLNY